MVCTYKTYDNNKSWILEQCNIGRMKDRRVFNRVMNIKEVFFPLVSIYRIQYKLLFHMSVRFEFGSSSFFNTSSIFLCVLCVIDCKYVTFDTHKESYSIHSPFFIGLDCSIWHKNTVCKGYESYTTTKVFTVVTLALKIMVRYSQFDTHIVCICC